MRDKLDWHAQAAIDAGQPEEHGIVHIACFLHWLGGHGWLEPGLFSVADRKRIADGSIELDELIDLSDEQLAAELATTQGAGSRRRATTPAWRAGARRSRSWRATPSRGPWRRAPSTASRSGRARRRVVDGVVVP